MSSFFMKLPKVSACELSPHPRCNQLISVRNAIVRKRPSIWGDSMFIKSCIISNILTYKYYYPIHCIICSINRQNRNDSNFIIQVQNRNLCFCVASISLEGRWLNSDVSWPLQIRNLSLIQNLSRKHLSPLPDTSVSARKCSKQENTDHQGEFRHIHLCQRTTAEALVTLIESEKTEFSGMMSRVELSNSMVLLFMHLFRLAKQPALGVGSLMQVQVLDNSPQSPRLTQVSNVTSPKPL